MCLAHNQYSEMSVEVGDLHPLYLSFTSQGSQLNGALIIYTESLFLARLSGKSKGKKIKMKR